VIKEENHESRYKKTNMIQKSGANGIWFFGFVGALIYFLHMHSGTFWLVVLAFLKALIWPAFLVYHLLLFLKV